VRKRVDLLNRRIAEFGAINLDAEIKPGAVEAWKKSIRTISRAAGSCLGL
jgi:hypothetical protein